tara:strand:+ start:2627 stop:2926 length:300 start_codon:yes stop_codon:yes gene_type:complete
MNEVLDCDAVDCSHVEVVGKITAEMVGMPCPNCGSNLLTADDWEMWKPFSALLNAVRAIGSDAPSDAEKISVRVGLHGAKTTIEFDRETPAATPTHNQE